MSEDFKLGDLNILRSEIAKAFLLCFGYALHTSTYEGNIFYTSLRLQMKEALGKEDYIGIPKEGWFIDLFNEDKINKHASKIKLVKEFLKNYYLKPFKIINGQKVYIENPGLGNDITFQGAERIENQETYIDDAGSGNGITYRGAKIINENFIRRIEKQAEVPTFNDFYLAKSEYNIQWYGVIKGWDKRRDETLDQINDKIKGCFNWKNSKIAAVIHGNGGCGKSTILRRLALESINKDCTVLWIYDLRNFCKELFRLKGNHLIFIEDYHLLGGNTPLFETFLTSIANTNNIRIILGDRDIRYKTYKKFVYENNYFKITTDDNKNIVQHVVLNNDKWKCIADTVFDDNVFQAPLFLILFVLARVAEGKEYTETRDVYALFTEVIEHDFNTLNDEYPGLVKVFFYWASILRKEEVAITWEAFLGIAELFADNKNVSNRFKNLDSHDPCCIIILNYLSIEDLVFPTYEGKHAFSFHHPILIDQGISCIADNHFYFDQAVNLDVVKILLKIGEISSAHSVYSGLTLYKSISEEEILWIEGKLTGSNFVDIYDANMFLKDLYSLIPEKIEENYWKKIITHFILTCTYLYMERYIGLVFIKLIAAGCNSSFIKDIHGKRGTYFMRLNEWWKENNEQFHDYSKEELQEVRLLILEIYYTHAFYSSLFVKNKYKYLRTWTRLRSIQNLDE